MADDQATPTLGSISPDPTIEEVAAIAAAIEVAWPRPVLAAEVDLEPARWRFSGRWWSKPLPSRRARP